jgi:hypothetical protein
MASFKVQSGFSRAPSTRKYMNRIGRIRLPDRARFAALVLASAVGLAAGCIGNIGSPEETGAGGTGADTQSLCAKGELPGPTPRLVRLTHPQYDNTVRELLSLPDIKPSASFIEDPAFSGFTNNAKGLLVSDRLARDYRRAAESLADLVSPEVMGKLVPCDVAKGDAACARAFIEQFGRRTYRRSLLPAEVDAYVALYERGEGKFTSGTHFEQGIRHVIEAFFQSPKFLYRLELSEELDSDELIPLDGFEVATRLSYLLWNSTPDEDLLAAAEAGDLATDAGIETQARRMLADPRASGPIEDFHAQWLQLARYDNVTKDPTLYPGFDAAVTASMKEETRRFIQHVILELSGGIEELLLSRTTYVNDDLAAIYGLEGSFGPDFVEVELDPTQRAGLLTQAGFLASHAYTTSSSPIHRGVFVQRRLLCATIPDPPPNIDTTLPPLSDKIKTTKQQVEVHTSPEACQNCHTLINAPGYALETFDAVGAWRETDNGEPVDPTGSFLLDGDKVDVNGPIDLATKLAESETAKSCYLTQWYRYGFARQESAADKCTINALNEQFAGKGYGVKDLLVAFTQTKTFRFRITEEVAQ